MGKWFLFLSKISQIVAKSDEKTVSSTSQSDEETVSSSGAILPLHAILNNKPIDLPNELHVLIFRFLATPDLIKLLAVNSKWNSIVLWMLKKRFPLLRNDHLTLPLHLKPRATTTDYIEPTGFSDKAFNLMAADLKRAGASIKKSRRNNYSRTTTVANSSGILSLFRARTREKTILCEPDTPSGNHMRALFQAVRSNNQEGIEKHFAALLDLKFSADDILNTKNKYNQIVLDIAAACGNVAALKFFDQQDNLAINKIFYPLLKNAAANNQVKVIKFIIKKFNEILPKGRIINFSHPEYILALMFAIRFKQYDAMKLLLKYGVPPHKVIELLENSTISGVSVERVHADLTTPQNVVQSPLTLAVDLGDLGAIKLMVKLHDNGSQWWRNWAADSEAIMLIIRKEWWARGHGSGGTPGYYKFKGYSPIHYILDKENNSKNFELLKYFLRKDKRLVKRKVDYWHCDGGTTITHYESIPLKEYPFQKEDVHFFVSGFSALVNAQSDSVVDLCESIIQTLDKELRPYTDQKLKNETFFFSSDRKGKRAAKHKSDGLLDSFVEKIQGLKKFNNGIEDIYGCLNQFLAEIDISSENNSVGEGLRLTLLGAIFYIEAHILSQYSELELDEVGSSTSDAKSQTSVGNTFK